MTRVLERVTATIREHEMLRPGDRVLVACSGGPDSVCLLYSLVFLRRLFKIRVTAFHFDHRLRPESAREAGYVRRSAKRLGLQVHVRSAEDRPPIEEAVEAWARNRRDRALREVGEASGADVYATGHTQDDQAETLLQWALMGDGLRAIRPRVGPYIRPLIDVSRAETEAFCRSLGLRPRRDPMNLDRRFLRAALRADVIPLLERATGRAVTQALARSAMLADEDERELTRQMYEIWDDVVELGDGEVRLRADPLNLTPHPIARRLVGQALFRLGAPGVFGDVEAVLDLAEGRPGRRRDLGSGLNARREREYVLVSRTSPESRV